MKVLVIHNMHRSGSASGDDQVFKNEIQLMENSGVQIVTYSAQNDSFDQLGIFGKVKNAFGMLWSFKHYNNVTRIIKQEHPDIVHVHTFFPLLSPSVLYAAKAANCKVVATLHDTRFVCPCATSLRKGMLCNLCMDGKYFRMCKNKCFKNSRAMSFVVAFIFKVHRLLKTFYKQIDTYICLNNAQIALLKEAGYEPNKISKKYNFVEDARNAGLVDETSDSFGLPPRFVVYYGRLGEEKGIRTLLKAWDNLQIPLIVMGDGPLKNLFLDCIKEKKNILYLGYVKHQECIQIVNKADFVVFPSIWLEGCSMVQIESESLSKPIIATDLGYSAESVIDDYNGFKFPVKDDHALASIVASLWNDPDKIRVLGKNARADYEQKYTPEKNIQELLSIYRKLL